MIHTVMIFLHDASSHVGSCGIKCNAWNPFFLLHTITKAEREGENIFRIPAYGGDSALSNVQFWPNDGFLYLFDLGSSILVLSLVHWPSPIKATHRHCQLQHHLEISKTWCRHAQYLHGQISKTLECVFDIANYMKIWYEILEDKV